MTQQQALHPLVGDGVLPIINWEEWMSIWRSTSVAEFRHSLLHFGFGVETRENQWEERILFYIEIARGAFGVESDGQDKKIRYSSFGPNLSASDIRALVARKAFEVLIQMIFKDSRKSEFHPPSWLELMRYRKIFDSVVDLFLHFGHISDYAWRGTSEHNRQIVRTFVIQFCRYGWEYVPTRSHGDEDEISKALFVSRRDDLVKILHAWGKLDVLIGATKEEPLDEEILELVKTLALLDAKSAHFGHERRRPRDIREAVYALVPAAQTYVLLDIQSRESKRISEISRLARERQENLDRLRELHG